MSTQIRTSNQNFYYRHLQCWIDIKESLKLWKLAYSMAWLDIKLRYKGSLLGPIWMTFSSATMMLAIGLIYGSLFKIHTETYLPYLSISFIFWQNGIANMIVDACQCFLQTDTFIHSLKLPFFLQAIRTVIRNFLITLLNCITPFLVILYYNKWPGMIILLSIPGFIIWIINSLAISIFLGCICARFRDIPQIINSLIQIVYYITPIMWMPYQIHKHQYLLLINPIFSTMQIIKGPILGEIPTISVYLSALIYSFVLWGLAWIMFIRSKTRLAFWI